MHTADSIIRALTPLARHFASPDYDRAVDHLCGILPFNVHVYGVQHEHNGWKIPPKYRVIKALVKHAGRVIYDGTEHPLGLPCHVAPFQGTVDLDTLKQHCWYDHRFPDAIPYHFRYSYRPWERDWGFCVKQTWLDALEEGDYDIVIETEETEPELKILDFAVEGTSGIEFVFIAHLDHPGMANDDLAGCAVGVEVFQRLRERETRHTYRLLLVQEVIGSQFHLHAQGGRGRMREGLFLEMLGADVPLALQRASVAPTAMECAVRDSAGDLDVDFHEVAFRESAKNDEIVFEAYGIPTSAICRFPYPEYHSSKDDLAIISTTRLEESVRLLEAVIDWHEKDHYIRTLYEGVLCLSNPSINLYVDPGQPAFGDKLRNIGMHKLMENMSLLRDWTSVRVLCRTYGIDYASTLNYLERWCQQGFIELV
jgi:aminopeptidase-like protein